MKIYTNLLDIIIVNLAYNEKHGQNTKVYNETFPDEFSVARNARITYPIMKRY